MTSALFSFPAHWKGAVRCDAQVFQSQKCGYCHKTSDTPGVVFCPCHRYCETHCSAERKPNAIPYFPSTWHAVLLPYESLAPSSAWNEFVLSDLTRKINAVDLTCMLNALHGLLLHGKGDDEDLCRLLLKMGVDAEQCYVYNAAHCTSAAVDDLVGGTAVHFAVRAGRVKCLSALIDAGVALEPETKSGKKPIELTAVEGIKEMLNAAIASEPKCVAQLASEGKFFAIFYRMRTRRLTAADLWKKFEGKSIVEWLTAVMLRAHKVPNWDNETPIAASLVLLEMVARRDLDGISSWVPVRQSTAADGSAIAGGCGDGGGAAEQARVHAMLLEGMSTLLNSVKTEHQSSSP